MLSSDLVPQIMKMLSATMQTVLQRFRKRQKTDFSLYQEFIPISQEPQAKAIWVCSISRTRKKPDMLQGILAIRHMHMKVFRETGMSTADEMLYPDNLQYLSDIMSYIAVGARSVENQYHRLVASGCDVPVGMKTLPAAISALC